RPVPAADQRTALRQLVALLAPAEPAIPDTVVTPLAPRPYGYGGSVEPFGSRTRPSFDALGAAHTLARMIIDPLLQPDRAGRLVAAAYRGGNPLTLGQTIDALVEATWGAAVPRDAKHAAIQRTTQRALAESVLQLAASENASP